MAQAIWVTVLCFPFTGAVAIAYAARVVTLLEAGDRQAAVAASRAARRWVIVSIILGAILVTGTIAIGAGLIYYYVYAADLAWRGTVENAWCMMGAMTGWSGATVHEPHAS
jgi:hypothetical protein